MASRKKPTYRTPKILELGISSRGSGGCSAGSIGTGACITGTSVDEQVCMNGSGAVANCKAGSSGG